MPEAQTRERATSGTVEANGITLAYASHGLTNREAILLIGGTGMQWIEWPIELVRELVNRGYRVVRFDSRDVGLSTHLDKAGLPDWAAITRAGQEGRRRWRIPSRTWPRMPSVSSARSVSKRRISSASLKAV